MVLWPLVFLCYNYLVSSILFQFMARIQGLLYARQVWYHRITLQVLTAFWYQGHADLIKNLEDVFPFPVVIKYPDNNNLKEKKSLFWPTVQGSVHHIRKVKADA